MISKERLEELIKEEATIWSNAYGKTHRIMLNSTNDVLDENILWRHRNKECIRKYNIKYLYETKSEAEFDAEFSNIEKVVKMPVPPTWEEFKKVSRIQAFNRNLKEYTLFISIENKIYLNECSFEDIDYETAKWVHKKILELPLTESNYIKALRKMVELFKEEV